MGEQFVGLKEVSEKFGIPFQTLRRLIVDNQIKHTRLSPGKNSKIFLKPKDVELYLEKHTYGGVR
ncbi:MAG: hypothetical protein HQL69_16630 [Magnetococcales bacterium]|nr:hypothetical protein [Magnetococcales bacterium]